MQIFDVGKMENELHARGYSRVKGILNDQTCDAMRTAYDEERRYRKTIVMERYRFGLGEYKYFNYPLPEIIQEIRTEMYQVLAPVANEWMTKLNIQRRYPASHEKFLDECARNQQEKATVLILKYGEGGYNCLHQDLYGDIYFPIQVVLFLSEPGQDYSGGEFVLTEQIPRAQSKVSVINPAKGDMLVFTTNFRPIKGSKGYYRVNMKHGVSEISSGRRFTLGIIFHDAKT
jgi:hypothetical protein